jgi:hypothetical protein
MLTPELVNLADKIMDYECGDMQPLEIIPFFQKLIDSGLAWKLQGGYGDQALNLIEQGYCIRSLN